MSKPFYFKFNLSKDWLIAIHKIIRNHFNSGVTTYPKYYCCFDLSIYFIYFLSEIDNKNRYNHVYY